MSHRSGVTRQATRAEVLDALVLGEDPITVRALASRVGCSVRELRILVPLEREGVIEVTHPGFAVGFKNGERTIKRRLTSADEHEARLYNEALRG